ncbi:MAG: tetratricopeptide repeat protein [Candidatus Eisenbacteria bacterium]|nr:tetratricopeptide repeat protein [Candidatus Eisenbacteria bacterium]
MRGLMARVLAVTERFEDARVSLGAWLLGLVSIVAVRHFLEQLAGGRKILYFLAYFLHYPLAYVAPLLGLTIVLAAFARERADRVIRLMLFAWLLTLLPPLLDMLVSRGAPAPEIIGYLIPRTGTLGQAFLNLWNPLYKGFQGPTAGIRIEAAIGCVLAACYVHLKTRSALRAAAAFVAIYVTMFFFFALPALVLAVVRIFGADVDGVQRLFFTSGAVHRAYAGAQPYALSDLSSALVDLFVTVPLLAVWCRMAAPERFRSVARLFDPFAAAVHAALAALGIALARGVVVRAFGTPAVTHPFDPLALAGIVVAAALMQPAAAAMAAAHADGDRPAGQREATAADGAILFTLAALFALSVSYVALTYVLGVGAACALRHARPFRLSRIVPASALLAGGLAVFLVQLGYASYAGASATLWMPRSVVAAVFAAGALAAAAAALLGRRRAVPAGLRAAAVVGVAAAAVWASGDHPRLRDELRGTDFPRVVAARRSAPEAGSPATAAMSEGLSLMQRGDIAGSAAAFRRAIEADPEYAPAYLAAGGAYVRLGRATEAARSFRRALALDPGNTRARIGIAQAHMLHARADSAIAVLDRAIELDPRSAEAAYTLACVYLETRDLEKERRALERTVAADPAHSLAQDRLGDIRMGERRYAEAVEAYKAAILGQMPVQHAHSKLARAYHALGELDRAVDAMRKEILASPRMASPHAVLAGLLAEQGNTDEARREYETALSLTNDGDLRALFQRELDKLRR